MRNFLTLVLLIILGTLAAQAYIPPTDFILVRTAENTPRVSLTVEYAVEFENGSHQFSTRESWIFADNGQMKLKVSQGFQLDIAYTPAERVFQDKQSRKTQKLSSEFLERFHFLKTPEAFSKMMLDQGITRERMQAPVLSRGGGVVNYGFFDRVASVGGQRQSELLFPGMWIEQDQFLFRQMRFRSQSLFQVEEYQQVGKFFFPKLKSIAWGKNQVRIKTISVTERKTIRPQDFNVESYLDLSAVPAEIKPTVLEFYSRFR
ncbi:MAG: hypothetical protein ACK5P5_13325 [Pseudobdellovibrionaceae bacterium]